MNILEKLLLRRGVKDASELSVEEKETYENWKVILSKETFTLEDVKSFCQSQLSVIEGKWGDLNLSQAKKAEFIPYHVVYKTLLSAIDSPRSAREALEQQLNQLTK